MSNNFNISTKLPKKYKIIREIGSGGMARVFLAEDQSNDNKLVAIKTLLNNAKTISTNKSRFKEEMRLAENIKSPYVVRFYEGCYDKESQYIVMEYVDGKILKDYIEERGRLTVEEAVDFGIQLAKGFASIHAQDIIHRDLKTSNIMVTSLGEIKIIDFGIAIAPDSARYTATNKVIGSVHYMAPEIINQEEPSERSDIYALGIVLYEMLIGEPPFSGKDPLDTALKHRDEKMKPVNEIYNDIPQSVANVVLKATAKNKNDRYESMRKLSSALSASLKQEKIMTKKISLSDDKVKQKKTFFEIINSKMFLYIIISSFAIVLFIVIILLSFTFSR
ncbi:MAG: serine/threonine-protein kinase [Metamycoplasmataceae bacterium]